MREQSLLRPAPLAAAIAALSITVAGNATAALQDVPGLTEIQVPVATNIQDICPQLNRMQNPTPEQTKLARSCTVMVQTGNQVNNTPGQALSLNLNAAQTGEAVQRIAPEEVSSIGRRVTEAGGRNAIAGRLLALRSGARGMMISGMLDQGGKRVNVASLAPKELRGGGASADTSPWGAFVNLNYTNGDRDATTREDAFDFDNFGVTAGADYRVNEQFVIGGALSWDRSKTDFQNNLGNTDADTWGVTAYGTWSSGSFYVDGHVSYSWASFDTTRNIFVQSNSSVPGFNTQATASPDGQQVSASLGAGWQTKVGEATLTPYARLDYLRMKTDSFDEYEPNNGLALHVDSRSVTSLQSALGARISAPFSTSYGVFTPYAGVEWNHEYKNDQGNVVAKYLNDPFSNGFVIPTDQPDRNYYTWTLGVSSVFARGFSGFLNFDTVSSLSKTSYYGITGGVRMEF